VQDVQVVGFPLGPTSATLRESIFMSLRREREGGVGSNLQFISQRSTLGSIDLIKFISQQEQARWEVNVPVQSFGLYDLASHLRGAPPLPVLP